MTCQIEFQYHTDLCYYITKCQIEGVILKSAQVSVYSVKKSPFLYFSVSIYDIIRSGSQMNSTSLPSLRGQAESNVFRRCLIEM